MLMLRSFLSKSSLCRAVLVRPCNFVVIELKESCHCSLLPVCLTMADNQNAGVGVHMKDRECE